ncbi:ImmA/IrrE family metallo-endopeptidase [Clostridium perfringens]|uniref:ImmA/IrrE family metallo-endopeptidase n=1 Tax=Clostridium perfringens TaxID=1502 RepID=UPI0024BC00C3|nr:ImmA/IrrE family metallo-endopeptidase [Clostridium perfringens]
MFQGDEISKFIESPEKLATEVLKRIFKDKEPSFPIDPFKILDELNVVYQFRGFKDLEGIYIVPEDEDDIHIIGINNERPITRQRFTAAHELCHYLKDSKESNICPIDGRKKSPIEKFADKFASALLMPTKYLDNEVKKYEVDGYISFDDVLLVSEYFGVSFESCVFNIAYKLKKISGNTDYKILKKRISNYKPNNKKIELGIISSEKPLLINIINSYKLFFENESNFIWYKFKNDFIYNENKMEGVNIESEDVAELITDLRVKSQKSEYCNSQYKDIIEVLGHSSVYDYILSTDTKISAFSILSLHNKLYQYAPYPEEGGKFRNSNNYVTQSKFETADYKEIMSLILELDEMVKNLLEEKDNLSISEYIDKAVEIHHKITVIHPFNDGNGRVSRAFLNWLFRLKNIPPVYLKYDKKAEYYDALKSADIEKDYDKLSVIFYKQIIYSMIQLNRKVI